MNRLATFTVEKRQLLNTLKQLKKLEKSGRKNDSTLEITIFDGYIRLNIPGIELIVQAFTKGSAKFTIRLWYITDVVNAETDKELNFTLLENELKLRGFTFAVQSTFFDTDSILRSINLPVNYTQYDLAKLYFSGKYTQEEIIFNNMDKLVPNALDTLEKDINKIALLMKQFGFTKKEVKELLMEKFTAGGRS